MTVNVAGNLRWKNAQIDIVAKGAVYLMSKDPSHTRRSALLAAQDRWLPPDRRKTNFGVQILQTLDKRIEHFTSMPVEQLKIEDEAAPPQPQVQVQETQQDVEAKVREHLRAIEPQLTLAAAVATLLRELAKPLADLAEAKMERIVEAAVSKHIALIAPKLKMNGNGASVEHLEIPAPAPEAEKKPKGDLPEKFYEPKIMFLGLLAKQPSAIKQVFRHIDMRILEPHTRRDRIEELSKKVDYCYIMARNAPPKLKLHCQHSTVPGGVTNLCNLIRERFGTCGEEAAQKRIARQQTKH